MPKRSSINPIITRRLLCNPSIGASIHELYKPVFVSKFLHHLAQFLLYMVVRWIETLEVLFKSVNFAQSEAFANSLIAPDDLRKFRFPGWHAVERSTITPPFPAQQYNNRTLPTPCVTLLPFVKTDAVRPSILRF
jgi:hypothetical protein